MTASPFAQALRSWRTDRRRSQLDLALTASVSQRHLSYLESGKAAPSRQMVLQLAAALELPLRARNELLRTAGFAAVFPTRPLEAEALAPVQEALAQMLTHHAPFPALIVDRDWRLLHFNAGITRLLDACGLDQDALARTSSDGTLNAMRLTLHPEGLLPFIENAQEVTAHLAARALREHALTRCDGAWLAIRDLVPDRPGQGHGDHAMGPPVLPIMLRIGATRLNLFTTLTTFGTPLDVTADELCVESLYPMDEATRAWFLLGDRVPAPPPA